MAISAFIDKYWGKAGGGERANYQMFFTEFTQALGLPVPNAKGQGLGEYEFEAPVSSAAVYSGKGTKRIDLYKRDCFILEAKQSRLGEGERQPDEPPPEITETVFDLFGNPVGTAPAKGKPMRRYDRLMEDARVQASSYALALPDQHATPPFLIVADIGRAFELYFDWAGNGRGYRPFPDERGYRILFSDLASDDIIAGVELTAADTLRAIWVDPASIDPRSRSARVTRDIAERLSRVAAQLEQDQAKDRKSTDVGLGERIEATSLFLMRTLFCMFAEDVELLPKDSFKTFLSDAEGRTDLFWRSGLNDLWSRMNDAQVVNRYWSQGDAVVKYFNGNLFSNAQVFDLDTSSKRELRIAADQDWRAVEPAIFGTLLEQVLTTSERAKLGAHYTPRPYVQRLVQATIMDVLTPDWEGVLAEARALADANGPGTVPARGLSLEQRAEQGDSPQVGTVPDDGRLKNAIHLVTAFHQRLAALRILDPACGTGNFLYVAMENLLRLESEVRQFVIGLGGSLEPAIHPNQFLGLELNPRAAVIAELVLWIGWLRFRLANTPEAIGEPVLPPLSNINEGTHGGFDAVLVRTATGEPDNENPGRPAWPEADFIIGNPPFIGGKDIRDRLGGVYAEALWKANPRVPKSADFVMHWWDRAADILTQDGTRLKRFGFVTTNSITQVFSRRVIEGWLAPNPSPPAGEGQAQSARERGAERADASVNAPVQSGTPSPAATKRAGGAQSLAASPAGGEGQVATAPLAKLHLTLAIPDHPWTRATRDAAAVRIAMTVAQGGSGEGRLLEIVREAKLDTDDPELEEREAKGRINADLSVGTDVTQVVPLKANEGLCSPGVKLHGAGFIVSPEKARELGLGTRPGLEAHIRKYRNGRDLLQRPRGAMVIDLFGLSEYEVMDRFPEVYQHVLMTVKPERDTNNEAYRRENWWLFGRKNTLMRSFTTGLPRYLGTSETAKHRVFHFLSDAILPDNMVTAIGSDDAALFGVLSSRIHEEWALEQGATLEDRPRYSKSLIFDPFPFPNRLDAVAEIADRLDTMRRAALADVPSLTVTGLYNLVAPIRQGTLPPEQEAAAVKARARIVAKLHDDLDIAVADAYGWGEEWRRAPLPPAEIVRRLVALNATRAKAEAAGNIRWLRPDYQIPRFGSKKA